MRRSAVVTADTHPIIGVLLGVIAGGSRLFPDQRVFANDPAAAIAWASEVASGR